MVCLLAAGGLARQADAGLGDFVDSIKDLADQLGKGVTDIKDDIVTNKANATAQLANTIVGLGRHGGCCACTRGHGNSTCI